MRFVRTISQMAALAVFVFVFSFPLHAQKISNFYDIKFQKLSIETGMPSNIIMAVVQDKKGLVWIATSNGLVRFDGIKLKIFQTDNANGSSISSNILKDIVIDKRGFLWISSANGIIKFNPETEQFSDWHLGKGKKINALRGYYTNMLLDNSERLSCFDMYTNSYIVIDTRSDSLLAVFDKKSFGAENWIVGAKRLYFVNDNDFWLVVEGDLQVVTLNKNNTLGVQTISRFKRHGTLVPEKITQIFNDKNGNIYCAANGLYFLPKSKLADFNFQHLNLPVNSQVTKISEDKNGNIWISGSGCQLQKYNPNTKTTVVYNLLTVNYNGVLATNSYTLCDKKGNLWVVENNGVLELFDEHSNSFNEFKYNPSNQASLPTDIYGDPLFAKIFVDASGNYWLTTQGNGLVYFSLTKTKFQIIKNLPNNSESLSSNAVWGIFEDSENTFWVGAKNSGLNLVNMKTGKVTKFISVTRPDYYGMDACTDFLQVSQNEIWMSSIPVRRVLINRESQTLKILEEFRPSFSDTTTISDWSCMDLFKDRKGEIWISTFNGLCQYQLPDKSHNHPWFKRYIKSENNTLSIANNQVWHVMEDSKNRLWVSTANGLSQFSPDRKKIESYFHNSNDSNSISSSNIKFSMQDHNGRIWIATEGGGLNLYNEKNRNFTSFSKSKGFPSDNIFAVFEDNSGTLWMSSTDGIISYNFETGQTHTFSEYDGLQSKQFVAGSFFQNKKTGRIFFGSDNGINHFIPDSVRLSTYVPEIAFVSLKIFNTEISAGIKYNGKQYLNNSLAYTNEIEISYKENAFSVEFAAFDFAAPKNIRYAYNLEGANNQWLETDAENKTLNFTNLASGNYVLKVKSTNADGVWCNNTKTITIHITPPWWKSMWFRILFLLVIASTVIITFRLRLQILKKRNIELEKKVAKRTLELQNANNQLHEKNDEILKQNEEIKAKQEEIVTQAEQLHFVDQQKLQFLTNISHEFRTPLSLIFGPVEKLIEQADSLSKSGQMALYKMIQRNSWRMLRLVNQVLDISKLEAGEMHLNISKSDLLEHVKPIYDSFQFVADNKAIAFKLSVNSEKIIGFFDPDKVEKIIYNLLSNAFKFTASGGTIELKINAKVTNFLKSEAGDVLISVNDTGQGIPNDEVKSVFNRFFQVKNSVVKGTGIGLSLTRDLVLLHKGTIEVESTLGQGSCFQVNLPLAESFYLNHGITPAIITNKVDLLNMALSQSIEMGFEIESQSAIINDKKSKQPILLVVEDNYDMRKFLADELSADYNIIEAADGAMGITIALDKIPDIIISDVMMPEVDGLTLCTTLKTDKHTSHIPIILLTARGSEESRSEGYETGADSYISKPFQIQVLKVRIRNLLHTRKILRQRFASEINLDPKDMGFSSADENFLNKAIDIIEKNLKDEYFNVEKLAAELGVHRVQLSRKFQALTNENISDFIRLTRLKMAAKLLLTRKFSISEVCYQVGFKDPAHFTRIFSKQFNITPSKYIEENRDVS